MQIRNLVLGEVGTFTSSKGKKVTFTEEDLKAIAQQNNEYYKQGKDSAIVLMHTGTKEALINDKVYGYLKNYRYSESKKQLLSDADVVKGKESEITSGKFRNFSMRYTPEDKRIVNLAIVDESAISSCNIRNAQIEELSAQYPEIDSVDFSTEGGLEIMDDKEEVKTFFQELKDGFKNFFASQKEVKTEEFEKESKPDEKEDKEEDMVDMEEFNALKAKADEFENYKTQVALEKANELKEKRENESKQLIEDFCSHGNMLPCQKESAELILKSDMAEEFKKFLAVNKVIDFDTGMPTFANGKTKVDDLSEENKKVLLDMSDMPLFV